MIATMLVLQLLIDILLVSVIFWLYWQDKNRVATLSVESSAAAGSQNQVVELQKEMDIFRSRLDDQLKQVTLLFERTNRFLDQRECAAGYLPISIEEAELKAALDLQKEKREIPRLEQIEVTKQRLKTESSFDLRTLLRGQLT